MRRVGLARQQTTSGEPTTADDGRTSRWMHHGHGAVLGAGMGVLVVALVLSAAVPPVAFGGIPSPLDPLRGLGGAITGGFGSMAIEAFDAIVGHLFAPVSELVTAESIAWLVEIPASETRTNKTGPTTTAAPGHGAPGMRCRTRHGRLFHQ